MEKNNDKKILNIFFHNYKIKFNNKNYQKD